MPSGLRARLKSIGGSSSSAPKRPERPHGVLCYTHREEADERLFRLPAEGLRRIGWSGRTLDIRRVLFLDTETTGLSGGAGTVAFLVGIGYVRGEDFIVDQFLMRDYSDETDLLLQLEARMREFDVVCTFNGKNFDLPLLQQRYLMNRLRDHFVEQEQIDLLYPARRTWKLRLGSCRLCRLEEFILDQPRGEDLPGSEVPQRYFDFLKCGDTSMLDDIIAHNRQDIITLGTLLAHLSFLYDKPEREAHPEDLLSMGKALEKQGELGKARELYRIASIPAPAGTVAALRGNPVASEAAWRAYLLSRKNKDAEAMRNALEQMANRRWMQERVYVELAKLYEHKYKNERRALRYAELAARYIADEERESLKKRRERLEAKIRKKEEMKNGTV